MNPENPSGGLPEPQPQGQQPPQVYGQQQFSPFPANQPGQQSAGKKTKLIVGIIISLAVALIGVAVALVLLNNRNPNTKSNGELELTQAYDSPVGLLPEFQSKQVRSGTFKLTANYVSGNDFTKEGTFNVDDKGHMSFEMVTDESKANTVLKGLYERDVKLPFDAAKHGVTRKFSYDFASVLGYHYLYDVNSGSGFIPAVEAAKANPTPAKFFNLGTTCDGALKAIKEKTDISTTNTSFELSQDGIGRIGAQMSFASRQAIDKAVVAFFDKCYHLDMPEAASMKTFVGTLREDVTASPTFTYGEEEGVRFVEISAPSSDTTFGGKMRFELSNLSINTKELSGETSAYVERRNQFGLAYHLCRIDPVVTRTADLGYRYLREDLAYTYPATADTGYYCTTTAVPSQFSAATSAVLKPAAAGGDKTVTGVQAQGLQAFRDLAYQIEQYNVSNKRYPGPTEFRDLATGGSGGLVAVIQENLRQASLVYTPRPAGCVGTCNDFMLSFTPVTGVQLSRSMY